MKLEEKLAALRKRQGLTQLELAATLGVSRQAISKWEVGTALPSTDNLIRLSQLYGVSVEVLINDALTLSDQQEPPSLPQPEIHMNPECDKKHSTRNFLPWTPILICIFLLCCLFAMRLLSSWHQQSESLPSEPIETWASESVDISSLGSFSLNW